MLRREMGDGGRRAAVRVGRKAQRLWGTEVRKDMLSVVMASVVVVSPVGRSVSR